MKINGFVYGCGAKKGNYRTELAIKSQDSLIDTGINWVSIPIKIQQKRYNATEILFDYNEDVTDKDIEFIVNRFHEKGIKVCLKPMISCMDGIWHGYIDFPDQSLDGTDKYWVRWFRSYTNFIRHYAEIAEKSGCEMFSIGSELVGTERKEKYWRELISEVRSLYKGPIVYTCDMNKAGDIRWLDGVDYIGVNAYYPVAKYPGDTMENMQAVWEQIIEKLEAKSKALRKPMILSECGCRSARGCAKFPNDVTHVQYPVDEAEQANYYESCLKACSGQDWLLGIFFREWSTEIYRSKNIAEEDTSFNIYKKKAEPIVRKYFMEDQV